jgi:uncharacterized protein YcbK (DUF882 family)
MSQRGIGLWTRRQFALTAVSALPVVCAARSWNTSGADTHRQLGLANLHTGEELTVSFHDANGMAPGEAAALRHLLRDYRVNEEHEMDFGLFVQLTDLAREAGVPAVYEVISGYRSPGTNATLRANGHHVAEHSQHMLGRAMDVRLRDCSLSRLHDLALAAQRGGVGYYPRSNFVHIDTGRVRSWQE